MNNILKNKDLLIDSFNLVNKCINTNDKTELAKDTIKLLGKTIQKSQEQTTKTIFYNDNNFFEKMKNSKYINFINKIKQINISIDEYKLPIIVFIGNESSGKSSLIRNILKCDIFPIDKNMCTKCPIKIDLINSDDEEYTIIFRNQVINLTDKEKIKLHIIAIMNNLDDIIEDEVYVKISNKYVINSIFYDLPGIIEYPADIREKSKSIINKYINKPNTLIICVIPANTTRLTSNQALGLINDVNKINDSIIALTMVDLLHNDDIELFLDRLLLKNNEVNKINIKKIIGVINHKNKDINENIWFENNILNKFDDNLIIEQIKKAITLENLLISIDDMFNDFISLNWKSNAINITNQKIKELENDYNNLGKKDLTVKELYNFIKNNINYNDLMNNCKKECCFLYNYDLINIMNINNNINEIPEKYELYKKNIISNLILNINDIFKIDNNLKIIRFDFLKNFLINEFTNIFETHTKNIDIWFNNYFNKFKYHFLPENFTKFAKYIESNFLRYFYTDIYNYIIDYNNEQLLIENNEWILNRKKINNEINKYKKMITFFQEL